MFAHLIIFAPLVILLLLAAGWDLASYTIPNFIPLIVLLGFGLFALAAGYSTAQYEAHALAALIALFVGFALFALGYIGGGDAKLFAAVAAWFGLHDLVPYVLVVSIFGGVLTLVLLAGRRMPLPAGLASRAWVLRLHEPRSGIPYGVALAAGALAFLPYTDLFHTFAA